MLKNKDKLGGLPNSQTAEALDASILAAVSGEATFMLGV